MGMECKKIFYKQIDDLRRGVYTIYMGGKIRYDFRYFI